MAAAGELRKVLDELINVPKERLVRGELGAPSLEIEPVVDTMQLSLRRLSLGNLEGLPTNLIASLTRDLNNLHRSVQNMAQIDLSQASYSHQSRDVAIQRFQETFNAVAANISVGLALSESEQHLANAEQEVAKIVNRMAVKEEELRERQQHVNELVQEMSSLLTSAREATQQIAVSSHAKVFADEAKLNGEAADRWFTRAMLAIGVTLSFGGVLLWRAANYIPAGLDTGQTVQLAVAKVILFSVLVSASVAAIKVYRAQLHNQTINKHRQNALISFEAFAKTAGDDQTKSAVLIQATQCIFSPQHTGFISEDREQVGGYQILEIVRSLPTKPAP